MPSQISVERCFAAAGAIAFYRPRFKRRHEATAADDYFSQAQAKYNRRRHHLYVNAPAARIIERAIAEAEPELRGVHLGGVTLGPRHSDLVAAGLRALLNSETQRAVRPGMRHVVEEFSLARIHHKIVTIVNADPAVPSNEVREIESEEEAHRAVIASVCGQFSPQFVTWVVSNIAFTPALRRLHHLRPDITTELQAVNELAAVLMLGGWEDLGLSDHQAGSLWYSFAKLLIEHHGDQAKAILKHGHPLHAEQVATRIRRELGIPKPKRKKARGRRSAKTRG